MPRAVERPHVLDRKVKIGAICRLGIGSLGDSAQTERAGSLEETRMFHKNISGRRRGIIHDAKP